MIGAAGLSDEPLGATRGAERPPLWRHRFYVGRVGSGFSEKELETVTKSFQPVSESPFSNPPPTTGVVWLKPEVVVEVTAMEVTHDGHLRAPVFLRLRDDKEPRDCLMEQMRAQP